MKRLLLLALLLNIVCASAQTLAGKSITVGTSAGGNTINGIEFTLSYPVYKLNLDSEKQQLTFVERDRNKSTKEWLTTGEIVALSLKTKNVLWSKQFYKDPKFIFSSDLVVQRHNDTTNTVFNKQTGAYIYQYNDYIGYLDDHSNIALSPGIKGVDLKSGQKLWEKVIPSFIGISCDNIDSSHILLIKNGLYKINLKTGEGWHLDGKTTVTYETQAKIYHSIRSNTIVEDEKIFVAMYDKVICTDTAGNLLWESKVREATSSQSELIHIDKTNILALVNCGFAPVVLPGAPNNEILSGKRGQRYLEYHTFYFGTAFIELIDMSTGKKILHTKFDDNIAIAYLGIIDSSIMLLGSGRRLYEVDLRTGAISSEIEITDQLKGYYHSLDADIAYPVYDNENLKTFRELYPQHYFLMNDSEDVVVLNKGIEEAVFFPANEWQWKIKEWNNITFLKKKNELVFIKDNKKLATIAATEVRISGNTMVTTDKNSLKIFDLNSLLN
jgi:hypothetical protein